MEALVGKRIRSLTVLSPDLAESGSDRSAAPDDGVHTLKRVLDSIRKYKRLVRTIIVVGTLLVAAISFLIPASYLATAQLAVDVRQSGAADAVGPSGAASAAAEESIIDTHVTVLLSDAYLRRLLPTFSELENAKHGAGTGTWLQELRTLVGGAWSAAKGLIRKREPEDVAALSALKRSLKAGQERRSRIISVTFADSDPQRAADTANTVAQSYVDEVARQKQNSVELALDALAAQSSRIQHDLAKAEGELKSYRLGDTSPPREALEWRVTTLAQQFEMLLRRRQELTASALMVQPDVSILALASPPNYPASLHPLLIVPPAAIVFALLACVLAVVLSRFDRTLYTETDATEALRIPCVGLAPAILPELGKQLQYLIAQPASDYARAIRSVLVSILASGPTGSRSQHIVLVTSSIEGEGKTTLAWSLGLSAARLGRRALLLDFGQFTRRPTDESASLLGVLTNDRPLAEAVQHFSDFGMDYLPAGLSDGNRFRILANPKLSSLFRQLSDAYDFVIIDGPSLLESPEARLLAGWADHVLLAIRWGSTSREMAQSTLHQFARLEHLDAAQDTRFSSVLTRADPSQHDRFGRQAERLLSRTWAALAGKVKAAFTRKPTTKAAVDLKRSASPNLKSRQ